MLKLIICQTIEPFVSEVVIYDQLVRSTQLKHVDALPNDTCYRIMYNVC